MAINGQFGNEEAEKFIKRDPALFVTWSCLTPRGIEEDWLRTNIF